MRNAVIDTERTASNPGLPVYIPSITVVSPSYHGKRSRTKAPQMTTIVKDRSSLLTSPHDASARCTEIEAFFWARATPADRTGRNDELRDKKKHSINSERVTGKGRGREMRPTANCRTHVYQVPKPGAEPYRHSTTASI